MKKILPILFFITFLYSTEDPRENRQTSLQKSAIREWKFFDVNSIYCTINSAGPYADYLRTNSSGLYWPKGSYKTAVYTSGIWIVGKHRPTGNLRTAVQQYATEFQPGPTNGIYNTATNDLSVASDPKSARHRIYKINKGDNAANNTDYAEWPGDLGAPYNDLNGNGKWDNGTDTPKLSGDQTLWCVYNDLDTALHRKVGTTLPMGVEVHAMYYGFNTSGPLANTMFIKWKIINKSDAHYDSLFIGLFSDLELGDANDDIDGYDTTLSLAYVFNGDDDDQGGSGYGSRPPACGSTFLGGHPEIVPYAYPVYIKSQEPYGDLRMGNPVFPMDAFNYLRGLTKTTGIPNLNPITNLPSRFAFTGDPITNTGWTRSASGFNPADVRSLLSLGPITLAPGDTQEVNAAFVIVQGNDRLESLGRLREYTATVRTLYANNFSGPLTTVNSIVQNDSVSLSVSVNASSLTAKSVTIDIVSEQTNTVIASATLIDNGLNGDAHPLDNIFSGKVALPASPVPVRINAKVTDVNDAITEWDNVATSVPLSRLRISRPIIISDNLNADGKANPGENIRYGLTIENPHGFSFGGISISSLDRNYANNYYDKIFIEALPGSGSKEVTTMFLSFSLSVDYTAKFFTSHLFITDSMYNQWTDSVTFPVESFIKRTSVASRISGRSSFEFEVVVTDPNSIRNHLYVLRGVDTGQVNYGFQIKDSAENRIILPLQAILRGVDFDRVNHLIPTTEGFKIRILSGSNYPNIKQSFLPDESKKWFSSMYIYIPEPWTTPISTVHFGDVPSTIIKFSKITGFTDQDNDGIFDENEPYTFDLANSTRTQKAFLYSQQSRYYGFIDIPFAVYDVTTNPPKKLTVVLNRSGLFNSVQRWLPDDDRIYIMSAEYNPNGVIYDSTKGGTNLLPQFRTTGYLSYNYYFNLHPVSEPMKDTLDFHLDYNPGLSSRDVYTFNPTEFFIIRPTSPTGPELSQNFPNPFNPSTKMHYTVVNQSLTTITIYNILGQKVKTLVNGDRKAGIYEVEWNGRDDNGIPVASGLYLYRFSSEGTKIIKKMMLIK